MVSTLTIVRSYIPLTADKLRQALQSKQELIQVACRLLPRTPAYEYRLPLTRPNRSLAKRQGVAASIKLTCVHERQQILCTLIQHQKNVWSVLQHQIFQ